MQLNALSNVGFDGIYVYFGLPGVSTLDAFLLGLPAAFLRPLQAQIFTAGIRQSIFSSYVQDDWKVSPKLTVNVGLRYEFFTHRLK